MFKIDLLVSKANDFVTFDIAHVDLVEFFLDALGPLYESPALVAVEEPLRAVLGVVLSIGVLVVNPVKPRESFDLHLKK